WIPEFCRDGENGFLIPLADVSLPENVKDDQEATALLDVLENTVVPMYYDQPKQFLKVVKTAMKEVEPDFESGRMAREYYEQLYR
ncbi:MAG TPA: alpha-glucan family phosphorylase, partial [Hymenobacter sp.]